MLEQLSPYCRSATEQTDAAMANLVVRVCKTQSMFAVSSVISSGCENCYRAFLPSDWRRRVCTDTDDMRSVLAPQMRLLLQRSWPLLPFSYRAHGRFN